MSENEHGKVSRTEALNITNLFNTGFNVPHPVLHRLPEKEIDMLR